VDTSRPGAPVESRLKPVKVLEIERGAALIEVLESGDKFKTRFSNLERDPEYLLKVAEQENAHPRRRARADNVIVSERWMRPENDAKTVEDLRAVHQAIREVPRVERAPEAKWPEDELAPEPKAKWPPSLAEVAPERTIRLATEVAPEPKPEPKTGSSEDLKAWLDELRSLGTPEALAVYERATSMAKTDKRVKNGKAPGGRYPAAVKDAAIRDISNGATPEDLLQKYGISHGTFSNWKKELSYKVLRDLDRMKAQEQAKADAPKPEVKPEPKKDIAQVTMSDLRPLARAVDVDTLERENRRLRATMTKLLEQPGQREAAALEHENRQLRAVVDTLLGLE
jgi:hypothetical protein